jgi:hypothetical protein
MLTVTISASAEGVIDERARKSGSKLTSTRRAEQAGMARALESDQQLWDRRRSMM